MHLRCSKGGAPLSLQAQPGGGSGSLPEVNFLLESTDGGGDIGRGASGSRASPAVVAAKPPLCFRVVSACVRGASEPPSACSPSGDEALRALSLRIQSALPWFAEREGPGALVAMLRWSLAQLHPTSEGTM